MDKNNNIIKNLTILLEKTIEDSFGIKFKTKLFRCKRSVGCDYYSNFAFTIAKDLKKNPIEVATKIMQSLKNITTIQIEIAKNGFFNITIGDDILNDILENNSCFIRKKSTSKTINIESICANPTGYMHIGHMRNAIYAKVLQNVLEFLGNKVSNVYYNNNQGNQINVCTQSVMNRLFSLEIENPDFYRGEEIENAAKSINIDFVKKDFEINSFDSKNFLIAREEVRDYFTNEIKNDIHSLGISFDQWFNESDLYKNEKFLIKKYLEMLKEKQITYTKDGALWIKTSNFGDDKDRVLVKSDGAYTYILPDAVYHFERIKNNYDMLIDVWGSDHHGYVKRLKILCEAMGYDKNRIFIPLMELVKLKSNNEQIKMSKRKGNVFWWRDLYNSIGKDASFFFLLSNSKNASIEIDINEAKKQTKDNQLYYCQYVYARSCQLLEKAMIKTNNENHDNYKFSNEEKELLKTTDEIDDVLIQVEKELDPVFLTRYAVQLAKAFHNFYSNNRVINKDEKTQNVRICIVQKSKRLMAMVLGLLGISIPNKM